MIASERRFLASFLTMVEGGREGLFAGLHAVKVEVIWDRRWEAGGGVSGISQMGEKKENRGGGRECEAKPSEL